MPRRSPATRIAGSRCSSVDAPRIASRTGLVASPAGAVGTRLPRLRSKRSVSIAESRALASPQSASHPASCGSAASCSLQDGSFGSQWSSVPCMSNPGCAGGLYIRRAAKAKCAVPFWRDFRHSCLSEGEFHVRPGRHFLPGSRDPDRRASAAAHDHGLGASRAGRRWLPLRARRRALGTAASPSSTSPAAASRCTTRTAPSSSCSTARSTTFPSCARSCRRSATCSATAATRKPSSTPGRAGGRTA